MGVPFWRLSTAAQNYTFDAYAPNNTNLLVSDHAGIGEQSATRLRFLRPIVNGDGYHNCAPGARVSFTTNANYFRMRLFWNGLMTRDTTYNSLGSILINEGETFTFGSPYAAASSGTHSPTYNLPAGTKTVTIVWPYSAGLDLLGIDLEQGATISAPTRPSGKIAVSGDSITHGFFGSRETNTWSYKLGVLKTKQMSNFANGGAAVQSADAAALIGSGADTVIYSIGYNNFLAQTPISTFQTEMQNWLTAARTNLPSAKILVGMFRTMSTAATFGYSIEPTAYRAAVLAAKNAVGDANTFYYDGHSVVPNDSTWFTDGVHFSDTGEAGVATAFAALV